MPRKESFSINWQDLCHALTQDPRPLTVQCGSPERARSLRGKWFAFKRVAFVDPELGPLAANISIVVEDSTVTFAGREAGWDAQVLEAALTERKKEDPDA